MVYMVRLDEVMCGRHYEDGVFGGGGMRYEAQ